MDPLIILASSIFIILLASFIVNFYYIRRHYLHHTDYVTNTTQTDKKFSTHAETQTNNQKLPVDVHDKALQFVQIMRTVGVGNNNPVQVEHCVQTDRVYYVALPEQLDQILEQLKINCTDVNHCMVWVSECEKATLAATQVVEKQSQAICNISENTQADMHQELQCQCVEILQDVQFQLNLLAETFEQNCIIHICQQEAEQQAQCPPWELLPYQRHTRSHQQYWNRWMRQDQFWLNIREQMQHGPPPLPLPLPHEPPMLDLEE